MKVGILGGGQLAQMLALAAHNIGINTLCFSESEDVSAQYGSSIFLGNLNDNNDTLRFAEKVDVITLENEFIDTDILDYLQSIKPVYPGSKALQTTQDRLIEKKCFESLNIPCAGFYPVENYQDLTQALTHTEQQGILKTRRMGYDGKGQLIIDSNINEDTFNQHFPNDNPSLILEQKIPFDFEVSIIATRRKSGEIVYYPLSENQHRAGILRKSIAPYEDAKLQTQAQQYMKVLLEHFDYVGTMAVEFFVVGEKLLANEIAPRVHNSGHWTIEGCECSQFENHTRAVCDLPLGSTNVIRPVTMFNIIGEHIEREKLLNTPGAHWHDYQKEARAGRKLGHVTIHSEAADSVAKLMPKE